MFFPIQKLLGKDGSPSHPPFWLHCCLIFTTLFFLLLENGHAADEPLPNSPAPHYYLDEANWLTPAERVALDEKLSQFERETSNQFLVAIFQKLPEQADLFTFCQDVFQKWKPGTKERDNGAILFIFDQSHKSRIQTGRGVEGVLPDARCKQILQDVLAPSLRNGQHSEGVNAAITAMIQAAKGEYQGTGKLHSEKNQGIPLPLIIFFIFIFLFFILPAIQKRNAPIIIYTGGGTYNDRMDGGFGGGGWGGGGGGGFSGGGGGSGGGGASGDW